MRETILIGSIPISAIVAAVLVERLNTRGQHAQFQMKKVPFLLVVLMASVVFLWVCAWLLIESRIPAAKDGAYSDRGQFGDMFGAITSLFSALGFAGVLYTVWLQTKEIQAQREEQKKNEEFRETQMKALTLSIDAAQEQIRIMRANAAPVIQWKSTAQAGPSLNCVFLNKGGWMKIERIQVLNRSDVGTDFFRDHIGTDQKGSVLFQFQ